MTKNKRLGYARERLHAQGTRLVAMAASLGADFEKAVARVEACRGTIVLMGFGKSGAVCAKISATLRRAGLRSQCLHPVEAAHGDLAALKSGDVVVAVSSSGETDELIRVLPFIRKRNIPIIAITSSVRSRLACAADIVLPTHAGDDPSDICASYSACLAALAVGDLIALSILHAKGGDMRVDFLSESSGPGGDARVSDIIALHPQNPIAPANMVFKDALLEITTRGLGAISIVDPAGHLTGIVTDGDVRRLLQRSQGSLARLFLTSVEDVMTRNPKRVVDTQPAIGALRLMEESAITVLPVVDSKNKPLGMIHLHDIVQLGLSMKSGAPAAKAARKPAKKIKK